MKILLLGPQASGKGTVGEIISRELNIPIIGVGQLLRELSPEHPRHGEIHKIMLEGKLAPQDFLAGLLVDRTQCDDCINGYIVEGWGRNLIDLTYFDPNFDKAIVLEIARETSIKRITGRRVCTSNGKTYNVYTLPAEMLKECTGELLQRPDDTEEAVNARLDIYYNETTQVIEKYEAEGKIIKIDGEGLPDEVAEKVLTAIKTND
jgi:adenylate kinase